MTIDISASKHVLIAGPTASGKSSLAIEIAERQGGVIVNADALQVFDGWRIVTARPDDADLNRADHRLYGHIRFDQPYSVGDWLREVEQLLGQQRLIIVGGTGLYLSALTEGLAEIPMTPNEVRHRANALALGEMIAALDENTRSDTDLNNRVRVQRAWEVFETTGKSIKDWQAQTPAPLLSLNTVTPIVLDAQKAWLSPRIERRFDLMLSGGALEEAEAMRDSWDPLNPSSKAIGAPELIAHLNGEMTIDEARNAAVIASRQFAKRQRTWFRKRMQHWCRLDASSPELSTALQYLD